MWLVCRGQDQKVTKSRARRSLVLSASSPQPKRRRRQTLMTDAESDAEATVASRSLDDTAATNRRRRRALKPQTDVADAGNEGSSTAGVPVKQSVTTGHTGVVPGISTPKETAKLTSDDDELPAFNKVNSSFTVGDLIWVKFRQYPFWPALVRTCSFLE